MLLVPAGFPFVLAHVFVLLLLVQPHLQIATQLLVMTGVSTFIPQPLQLAAHVVVHMTVTHLTALLLSASRILPLLAGQGGDY